MFDEDFAGRLVQLRLLKNVSARDMSLSIGQNAGYISNIESGKALPSMSAFFFICDYFSIAPSEFFEMKNNNPLHVRQIFSDLKYLDKEQLNHISAIVQGLKNSKGDRIPEVY